MPTMPRLPVREMPLPGESLTSLVRRHVWAMGYESFARLFGLLTEVGGPVPHHLEQLDRGPVMNGLATLLRQDEESLLKQTVHSLAGSLVLAPKGELPAERCDSKTLLKYFELASRQICPSCLDNKEGYERLNWLIRPVFICVQHRSWLIDHCPNCHKAFRSGRADLRRSRCGRNLGDNVVTAVSSELLALQAALETWLSGKDLPLAETSTAACFWWLERLKAAVSRTPSWIAEQREQLGIPQQIESDQVAWTAAADILRHWPQRLGEFLDVFQTVDKKSAMATGTGRAFGRLLREASYLERSGYSTPADALRQYLLSRFTRGHLNAKVCLFRDHMHQQTIQDRDWLTRTQAAKQLRLRQTAIPELVTRGLLQGQVLAAGRRTIGLITGESVRRLQSRLEQALTIPTVANRLRTGKRTVLDLIHADVLHGSLRTRTGWLIPREQVDSLENALCQLPACASLPLPWVECRTATRRFGPAGLTLALLIKLIKDGQVRAARDPSMNNLRGLWVHQRDLERNLPQIIEARDETNGYPLNRLALILFPEQRLKEIVLRKWIRAGLLRARRSTKRWFIAASEVERFRATYCLAGHACQTLGISRSSLHRCELEGRIAPIYSRRRNRGAGASVFLRADVERLRRQTAAA
jgi:excisionase family DNA binding protein